jgi:hypothetical protein
MPAEMLRRFDYFMLDSTKRDFKYVLNRLEEINVHQKSGEHYYGHTRCLHISSYLSQYFMSIPRFIRAEDRSEDASAGLALRYAMR